MNRFKIRKIALSGIFVAIAVVGSLFSFPVFGSRCAPVQHVVNILSAVMLGPWYGVVIAFISSVIRLMTGLGSPLAFPGSMFGALLSGLMYYKFRKMPVAVIFEVIGTAILGGLCAYPVAILVMGKSAGELAFYAYVIPFLISTAGGSVLASLILVALSKTGMIKKFNGDK
ncbi:MAG: energy coupling factor transporter S component ThiW [Clostridiales bacterium]|nr:energy coupling factor transporter S component ThiW [Clostridiales bacterium]